MNLGGATLNMLCCYKGNRLCYEGCAVVLLSKGGGVAISGLYCYHGWMIVLQRVDGRATIG
jgi:hypothetical protein